MRFDMPAVGIETIETMKEVRATVLAVEAGKTIAFDIEEMKKMADKSKIAIIGIDEAP